MRLGHKVWKGVPIPDRFLAEQFLSSDGVTRYLKGFDICVPDLKAFERRLTEVIDKVQPTARLWRMVLIVISVCTAAGAGTWLLDPYTTKVSLSTSLWNHPFFTISCIVLLMLFLCGIHKRVVAPSIIASRCRQVLADFNMSCDDTGKLILKPRPSL